MDVLSYLPVDPYFADIASIYIRRRSLAQPQKQSLDDAVARLERTVVTTPVIAADQATMRSQQESEMVFKFADRSQERQGGRKAASWSPAAARWPISGSRMATLIVVPSRTDLVVVSGEVGVPQSLVWRHQGRPRQPIHRLRRRLHRARRQIARAGHESQRRSRRRSRSPGHRRRPHRRLPATRQLGPPRRQGHHRNHLRSRRRRRSPRRLPSITDTTPRTPDPGKMTDGVALPRKYPANLHGGNANQPG